MCDYICVYTKEPDALLYMYIIGIYIHQIHHLIVYLVYLSERVTNPKEWIWSFSFVESLQTLFYGLNMVLSNLCKTEYLVTSS